MSIFKNLSTGEKKKLIKELESMPHKIGFNEKIATNIHWLIWKNNDYHLTEEERAKREKGEYYPPSLTITDGEVSIMTMPLRPSSDMREFIDPDSIPDEDVKKARKYKTYLNKKAGKGERSEYYYLGDYVILKRKEFFVVIPKESEYYTAGFFEIDPEKHKNIEDLFHKSIGYYRNITHGNFWHLYENGTGVCFNA